MTESDPVQTANLRASTDGEREAAWRAFHAAHAAMVYAAVLRAGVPPGDVEDVFQRVFMFAFRRIQREDVERVRPWLRGIVLRVVLAHRRWYRVRQAKRWMARWMVEADELRIPTPERTAEQLEAARLVWSILGRLSDKLREALILCDLQGCTPSEAAEVLGVSVNTVRSRRRMGKEKFAAELGRRRRVRAW